MVSRRAFQGLTETAAEDCVLFLLPQSKQGQREGKKNENDRPRIREGTSHAYPFYGGEFLGKMGAAWFVSYAYHEHVDATHGNWSRTTTASGRMCRYNNTFSYHRYWLDKVMTMNDQNLAKNTIGLAPREVKDMANAVMSENW